MRLLLIMLALLAFQVHGAERMPKLTPLVTRLGPGEDGRYNNHLGRGLTNLGTGPRAPGYGAHSTVTTVYRSGRSVTERNGQIIGRTGRTGSVNHNGKRVYFK